MVRADAVRMTVVLLLTQAYPEFWGGVPRVVYVISAWRMEVAMQLIMAIIWPEKLAAVQTAMEEQGASLLAVTQTLGGQREPACMGIYRGREYPIRRLQLRLDIAVDDWRVDATVAAILHAGSTGDAGQVGDCKVCVLPLDTFVASGADQGSQQGAVVSLHGAKSP
jgi:nitrogen regulatory protein PII